MNSETHFHQEVRDFIRITNIKLGKIMGVLADVTTELTAINTALDAKPAAFTAGLASLKASVDTALADLAAAGASGQSAIIDSIVTSLKSVHAKIDAMETSDTDQLNALKVEIEKAIAAVPVPVPPAP